MPRPQDPNLHRSGQVPALDPDATESELDAHDRPDVGGPTGPVPPDNRRTRPSDPTDEDVEASDTVGPSDTVHDEQTDDESTGEDQ